MQTIGEKLEEARKRRGISLREASEVTKIRAEYLGNFENNSFEIQLPEVYIRGFLRSYANFLKLNADKIITDYNAHLLGESKIARNESREFLGRMDIADPGETGGGEPGEESRPARHPAPAPAGATESGLEYNNFDKASLIKGGIAVGGAGILVAIIVFVVLAVFKSDPDETTLAQRENASETAAAQQELTLTASGGNIDNVTVTEIASGLQLFRGPLVDGQSQTVPFDRQVEIVYTHAQYLRLAHDGQEYQMGGRNIGKSTFPPTAP